MKLSSPLISWEHLLITDVSRSHPAVTWTGLVTETSTRVVEEQLGTHGVLITGLLFFPAGTAFIPRIKIIIWRVEIISLDVILIAEVSRLLVGWSGLFWTALSLQLPRTHRVLTGVLEQLLPAETLLLGPRQ